MIPADSEPELGFSVPVDLTGQKARPRFAVSSGVATLKLSGRGNSSPREIFLQPELFESSPIGERIFYLDWRAVHQGNGHWSLSSRTPNRSLFRVDLGDYRVGAVCQFMRWVDSRRFENFPEPEALSGADGGKRPRVMACRGDDTLQA